jgi:hypothetical protein
MIWFIDDNKTAGRLCARTSVSISTFAKKFEALASTLRPCGRGHPQNPRGHRGVRTVGDRPHAVVLDGIKGAGIREVEETVANHSMVVTPETCDRWLDDLRRELQALEGGEGA